MTSAPQKTLLVLGARRAQIPAIQSARDMGLRVIAIDPDPDAPGLALASAAYVLDLAELDTILAVARENRIDGVMTLAADYPMPVLAQVCASLCLPGPSPEAVARATNKRLMRLSLQAAGVPCPHFFHVTNVAQAMCAITELTGDAIFKPAMSQGGRGVTKVKAGSSRDLIEMAFKRAMQETRADGVMVEAFVDGPEFSVESLSYNGTTQVIAVTDKLTSGSPYFVELGHNQPSRWLPDQVELLRHTAIETIAALGIDQAPGHTEIRLGRNGPVVMETASRLGGGFITSRLLPISTGIDLVAASIRVALGETPDLVPKSQPRAAAIRFVCAEPGVLSSVAGVEESRQGVGVEEVELYHGPGDRIPVLVDATGRVGHVICSADNAIDAVVCAETAMRHIRIDTFPDVEA